MEKNKEKELINEALHAIKSGEYIKQFQTEYINSLNNIMLDSNKMNLTISILDELLTNKNNKKLKEIDYAPTLLSSIVLSDRYYDQLKDKDQKLLVILSYCSYYLVGTNTDDFILLFGDGLLVNKLINNKEKDYVYLLDDMGKALNSFNFRKDLEDINIIKQDLIENSTNINNLEPLFKLDPQTKANATYMMLDKGVKTNENRRI